MKRLRHKIERAAYALRVLEDGLDGKPRTLGAADAESVQRYLAAVGVELLTRTAVKRRGYRLKRGARPLARRYFCAPLKRYADLFDLGSQCAPVEGARDERPTCGGCREPLDEETLVREEGMCFCPRCGRRVCRLCGCTEDEPCPEGCWWKEGDPEVCDAHDAESAGEEGPEG